jgi:hypothetical protein
LQNPSAKRYQYQSPGVGQQVSLWQTNKKCQFDFYTMPIISAEYQIRSYELHYKHQAHLEAGCILSANSSAISAPHFF